MGGLIIYIAAINSSPCSLANQQAQSVAMGVRCSHDGPQQPCRQAHQRPRRGRTAVFRKAPALQHRKAMAIQQACVWKQHDRRDVGGIALAVELLEAIAEPEKQLGLSRMQIWGREQADTTGAERAAVPAPPEIGLDSQCARSPPPPGPDRKHHLGNPTGNSRDRPGCN